jgi:hypothetical protein
MRLLNISILMSRLRRMVWMKWLPPMARASPSPVITHTISSGRDTFSPEAKEGARPCSVCIP